MTDDWSRERLQLADDCLARRDPLAARDVVPLRIARKEIVAGAAEPLPQRFGAALLHRTDGLPLGLQLLDLGGGGVPVGRLLQRLDFRDERIFLREVRRPDGLALREIGVPAREELVARRAEPLPDGLLLAARDRADRF